MEVKSLKLDSITPYGKNAKKHDKRQINNVAESIKQYGFVQPIQTYAMIKAQKQPARV